MIDEISKPIQPRTSRCEVCALFVRRSARFVLRVGGETAAIDLAPGAAPCNDGILTILKSQEGGSTPTSARSKAQKKKGKKVKDAVFLPCGLLELKLHDDAGDLELWICKDGAMEEPLDFPAHWPLIRALYNPMNRLIKQ